MPNADDFYELVSGRRRGVGASLMRGLLAVGEGPYGAAVWWRNRRYDRGASAVHRVEVPVVSVGNLTVGGTGKTPMVKWIASHLRQCGLRVSIISRGYGAHNAAANDEALELEQALPDVPHVQNPDRVAAARLAIDELATECILLDDGFQHRRLARDLDIVLLDATQPFGYEHLLPRGTLRESLRGLARADAVCLTRSDLIDSEQRESIRARAMEFNSQLVWCEATHAPTEFVNASGESLPIDALRNVRVMGFCGIGNPDAFRATLSNVCDSVAGVRIFPDHHNYARDDVNELAFEADALEADWLVCTRKDLVKLGVDDIGGRRLAALAIEMRLTAGQQALAAKLDEIAQRTNSAAETGRADC